MSYRVLKPSTIILNIHALRTSNQTILSETFQVKPSIRCEEFQSVSGENRFVRLDTGKAKELLVSYNATVQTHPTIISRKDMEAVPISQLNQSVIPYLFPSRYCQSDRVGRLAWKIFGDLSHPYQKVVAISDWIFENVEYLRGFTNSETSAYDTITQRAGVCRDFAHLGITLCRALTIPARYFSGYASHLEPPDFHACFEAYIGNRWFIFDPTRLAPLNGLVKIAAGRDAADASVASLFGWVQGGDIQVSCKPAVSGFKPWTHRQSTQRGLSLDG